MLFPDIAHRDLFALAVGDGHPKEAFTEKNAFGVMAKGAVAEIGKESLGLIDYVDN